MPQVTVVIPCYNAAAFLEPCLKTVIAQSLEDLQILVVDDGSTDDSRAVAERMAATDRRITVLAQAHRGPGDARNCGLDAAGAPYVTFVDSDDQLPADACEQLVRTARNSDADIVTGRMGDRAARAPAGTGVARAVAALYTGGLSVSACAKLYRRSFLAQHDIRFPERVYIEDRHFVLQCLVAGARVALLNHVVYHRRLRPESTMHQVGAKHIADTTAVYRLDTGLLQLAGYLEACGRHAAWATLVVDAYLARAIPPANRELRRALAGELERQEELFRALPGSPRRSALLANGAARLRRAVERGGNLRLVRAELALLKVLAL